MIFGWGAQCAEKAAEKEQSEDAESENAQTRLVISAGTQSLGKVAQAKVVVLRCAKCAYQGIFQVHPHWGKSDPDVLANICS